MIYMEFKAIKAVYFFGDNDSMGRTGILLIENIR